MELVHIASILTERIGAHRMMPFSSCPAHTCRRRRCLGHHLLTGHTSHPSTSSRPPLPSLPLALTATPLQEEKMRAGGLTSAQLDASFPNAASWDSALKNDTGLGRVNISPLCGLAGPYNTSK